MKKRTIGRAAAAVACAAGLIGATSVISSADAAPAGFLTVFDAQNQGGDQRLLTSAVFDFRSIGFNDRASSVFNQTNVAWVVAEASFLGARLFCLRPGEGVNDLHSPTLVFQDRISSAQPLGSASCAGFPAFFG